MEREGEGGKDRGTCWRRGEREGRGGGKGREIGRKRERERERERERDRERERERAKEKKGGGDLAMMLGTDIWRWPIGEVGGGRGDAE